MFRGFVGGTEANLFTSELVFNLNRLIITCPSCWLLRRRTFLHICLQEIRRRCSFVHFEKCGAHLAVRQVTRHQSAAPDPVGLNSLSCQHSIFSSMLLFSPLCFPFKVFVIAPDALQTLSGRFSLSGFLLHAHSRACGARSGSE